MTFELVPFAGVFAAIIIALAVVGGVVALAAAADFVARNRPVRIARRQSVPAYYRALAVSH